jgi:hypothetical protein
MKTEQDATHRKLAFALLQMKADTIVAVWSLSGVESTTKQSYTATEWENEPTQRMLIHVLTRHLLDYEKQFPVFFEFNQKCDFKFPMPIVLLCIDYALTPLDGSSSAMHHLTSSVSASYWSKYRGLKDSVLTKLTDALPRTTTNTALEAKVKNAIVTLQPTVSSVALSSLTGLFSTAGAPTPPALPPPASLAHTPLTALPTTLPTALPTTLPTALPTPQTAQTLLTPQTPQTLPTPPTALTARTAPAAPTTQTAAAGGWIPSFSSLFGTASADESLLPVTVVAAGNFGNSPFPNSDTPLTVQEMLPPVGGLGVTQTSAHGLRPAAAPDSSTFGFGAWSTTPTVVSPPPPPDTV